MSKIPDLIERSLQYDMPGIAITDHGAMYGVKEFLDTANTIKNEGQQKYEKILQKLDNEHITSEQKLNLEKELIKAEKQKKFKPIVGFEAYVAQRTLYDKDKNKKVIDERKGKERIIDMSGFHLVLLAKNRQGYKNLCKLVSIAWIDGHYYHPRIDKNVLKEYSEGLVVLSACLGGEIPQLILNNKIDEAEQVINWFKSVFGEDYYLEVQLHKPTREGVGNETYLNQLEVNKAIKGLAVKTNTKIVATNDLHFVDAEHADAHERLVCLSTGKKISDSGRLSYTKEEYLKTEAQMKQIFADMPEVIDNTIEVLDKITEYTIDAEPIMPKFDIPETFASEEQYRAKFTQDDLFKEFSMLADGTQLPENEANIRIEKLGGYNRLYRIKLEYDYLKYLTYEGAKIRFAEITPEIEQRIDFELNTVKLMGYPGYFLIVQDFVAAAKQMGVLVGPGRGSAAGSVAAYCLFITNVNPFDYDLLFERFLNPDRISLPDIDIDFDNDGLSKVLDWVTQKYGSDSVAHIINYGTMATKLAITDVGRVQEVPLNEVNALKKLIPEHLPDDKEGKEIKMSVANLVKHVPDLRKACREKPQIAEMMKYAEQLEGTVRQTGVHACGIIISPEPLTNFVPLSTAKDKDKEKAKNDEDILVTQYDGHVIEQVGLIKMDFLALKTLSIIKETLINIKKSKGIDLDINSIDLKDEKTYEIYSQGKTVGVFQFESPGMQKYLKELKPTSIEDLIAMNALYRPGPMDYIPDFISRKHGRTPIKYDIPVMEKYLKDTYGITVYQEQVMLLSRLLANFTPGEADTLRKAMGKKQKETLAKLKPKFIAGGVTKSYSTEILEKIWADWEKFASYAFNKSHSACYSLLSFQTAYLKAHFPAEFMAANLTCNKNKITEVNKFMEECKSMKIPVLGPDINESDLLFMVNKKGEIRFGLGGVKNVGEKAIEGIVGDREQNGNYTDVYDFFARVNLRNCNKRNIESLILAGAFDCFKTKREDYFFDENTIENLITYGKRIQTAKEEMQNSLFGGDDLTKEPKPQIPKAEEWTILRKLNHERDLIGIYLSSHPLDEYRSAIEYGCTHNITELQNVENQTREMLDNVPQEQLFTKNYREFEAHFVVGGIIVDVKHTTSKAGKDYGIFTLEDYSGQMEFRLFDGYKFDDRFYTKFRNLLQKDLFVVIKGLLSPSLQKDKQDTSKIYRHVNLHITSMQPLENEAKNMIKNLKIKQKLNKIDKTAIDILTASLSGNKGRIPFEFEVTDDDSGNVVMLMPRDFGVELSPELLNILEEFANDSRLEFAINNKYYKIRNEYADNEEFIEEEIISD
jgi:DNA polymerase-3 subunit alpha